MKKDKMNAYFTAQQTEKCLRVIAKDQQIVDLLRNQNPESISILMKGILLFEFTRSKKTITLLRLLGVYGELK